MPADVIAGLPILVLDGLGFSEQSVVQLVCFERVVDVVEVVESLECPTEIDGGGSAGGEGF